MVKKSIILLCFAQIFLPAAVYAQGSNQDLEKLLSGSGLEEQIAQIVPVMRSGIEQAAASKSMSQSETENMLREVEILFAPGRIRSDVLRNLDGTLTREEISAVLAWLQSETGRKITRLEVLDSTPEAIADTGENGASIFSNLEGRRKNAIVRLADSVKAAEMSASVAIDTGIAMAYGLNLAMPDSPGYSLAQIRELVEQNRPQIIKRYESRVLASFAHTYRSLSDTELDAYINFVESKAGRSYNSALYAALDKAISSASQELGNHLAPRERSLHNG